MKTEWLSHILQGRREMLRSGQEPRFIYVSAGGIDEIKAEMMDTFGGHLRPDENLPPGLRIAGMPVIERPDLLPLDGDWAISSGPAPGV